MRIVHTSDWHAGRLWKTRDRLDELEATLDHLGGYVTSEKVDLLLMTGDVFDHGAPSADAERVVFDFFKRVGLAKVQTVVIAGNHDSPRRMAAWGALTQLVNVFVIERARSPRDGGVLELHTHAGERAVVAALPFADVGDLVSALELADESASRAAYAQRLSEMFSALAGRFHHEAVNLMLAHTHIEGAVLAHSERQVHVGEQWAGTAQSLPDKAHYVALGHIHKPQPVKAPCPARYAGSPMQLDFGEIGDEKSFVVIEAEPRVMAKVQTLPYRGAKPLLDLRLSLEELERDAAKLRDAGWLRLTIPLAAPRLGLSTEVRRHVPNAVEIKIDLPKAEEASLAVDREKLTERERFEAYLLEANGAVNRELVDAFEKLRLELSAAERDEASS